MCYSNFIANTCEEDNLDVRAMWHDYYNFAR
jgi:hypothetical protein